MSITFEIGAYYLSDIGEYLQCIETSAEVITLIFENKTREKGDREYPGEICEPHEPFVSSFLNIMSLECNHYVRDFNRRPIGFKCCYQLESSYSLLTRRSDVDLSKFVRITSDTVDKLYELLTEESKNKRIETLTTIYTL